MVKIAKEYYYLIASNAHKTRGINIIESSKTEEDDDIILVSKEHDPEAILILRETFNSLSKDARQVIDFLLDAPEDLLRVLKTEKSNKLSVKRFRKLMISSWGAKKSRKIFWELTQLMKSLR